MILLFFLQINLHFPTNDSQLRSTFCICQDSQSINCSKECSQYKIIDFNENSISNCLKNYSQELINFLIVGTNPNSTQTMPKFDLNIFQNVSAIIYSLNKPSIKSVNDTIDSFGNEHIILYNGTAGKDTNILFTNIHIHLLGGKYEFNNLNLFNSRFTHSNNHVPTSLSQKFISGDYDSISRIPITVHHYGPTRGAEIDCTNSNVNNIHFLNNLNIVFSGKEGSSAKQFLIDLSQVGQKYNTTLIIYSKELNLTFDPLPINEHEIPRIVFKMQANSKVFINSDQFESDKILKDRITFNHQTKTLYLYSKNGTTPPLFDYVGNGYRYVNDKKRVFHSKYCVCPALNCEEKCGKGIEIIEGLDSISLDQTVVGNPSSSLSYIIANTKGAEGKYPVFDLEHFGDKKLSIIGSSSDEHVGFIGDATDDVGEFSLSKLTMHTKSGENYFRFPNVSFRNVNVFQLKNEQDSPGVFSNKEYFLKSLYLIIDFSSLKNFVKGSVAISAPQNGIEIHASNIENDLDLKFYTSNQIELCKLTNISMMPHTTLSIFTTKNVNFFISSYFPRVVSSFPKLRIIIEGDESNVSFVGSYWSKNLPDISAKVSLIHGDASVHVVGDYDASKNEYSKKPPIVDHEGNGPFFLNGVLSNFKNAYCVCAGEKCLERCSGKNDENHESLWPAVGFTEKEIEKTVVGNPTKQIKYFIHGSSPDNRPFFGLHTFQSKSFAIVGCNDGDSEKESQNNTSSAEANEHAKDGTFQYIWVEGTDHMQDIVSSSVSHIFTNVDILLTNPGIYFFNNVVFTNCRIELNKSVSITPRGGQRLFFRIIQNGMTADMPTLHSFSSKKSDNLAVPCHSYLTVNGGYDLAKVIIDDLYHLVLTTKDGQLDSRIDASLLKRNPPLLKTHYGTSENEPLLVEWKKNNDIKIIDDVPHFIIDVSDVPADDAYISFIGRKWNGAFKNLSEKISIKHDRINVHLITEKMEEKNVRIKPPIINFDGTGDIYIDEKKQLSKLAVINGKARFSLSYIYDDDDDEKKLLDYIIIFGISSIIILLICYFLFVILKKREIANYGKMKNTSLSQYYHNRKDQESILPMEPFKAVDEQSD